MVVHVEAQHRQHILPDSNVWQRFFGFYQWWLFSFFVLVTIFTCEAVNHAHPRCINRPCTLLLSATALKHAFAEPKIRNMDIVRRALFCLFIINEAFSLNLDNEHQIINSTSDSGVGVKKHEDYQLLKGK